VWNERRKLLNPRTCFWHVWLNKWCKLACPSLIFTSLWLMLKVQIIMQFVKFTMVTQMLHWRTRNIHAFTIGKKAYEQRTWYFLLLGRPHWSL
jgi:hypothetical protein